MPRGCKICRFFENAKWLKPSFEKKVEEGSSLRLLQAFLEGQGLECDTKTISKHIRECMDIQVTAQRFHEKAIQKAKKPFKKLSSFFINPEPLEKEECLHSETYGFWDLVSGEWVVRCKLCNKELTRIDPDVENKRTNTQKDLIIYSSLNRGKRT